MNPNTLFTIAIPAYKSKFLGEAIDSCLSQTYGNFELVIVDDASPEDLKSVVDRYHDNRIRFYRNEKNCGAVDVVDNWNICLSYAKGDYIICMGDDDKLLPCCLEEYLKLMEKYPGLGVYHAWTEIIDEESVMFDLQQPRPEWESALSVAWNRWNGRTRQFIGDFCYEVKRLRKDGGFFKLPMAWGSDDICAVRAAVGGGIANTQRVCFQYRVNRYTISKTGANEEKFKATLKEREWYRQLFAECDSIFARLSETEKKYLHCLKSDLPRVFTKKFKSELVHDMEHNPLRFFFWIRRKQELELSMGRILYYCLVAIKNMMKKDK